jgi:hypothetical protein
MLAENRFQVESVAEALTKIDQLLALQVILRFWL